MGHQSWAFQLLLSKAQSVGLGTGEHKNDRKQKTLSLINFYFMSFFRLRSWSFFQFKFVFLNKIRPSPHIFVNSPFHQFLALWRYFVFYELFSLYIVLNNGCSKQSIMF